MILKNYYKILAYTLMSNSSTVPSDILNSNEDFQMVTVGNYKCIPYGMNHPGNYLTPSCLIIGDSNQATTISSGSSGLYGSMVIGSGTTPPTLDDYCMENEITNLTKVSTNYTYGDLTSNLGFSRQVIKKYVNETGSEITISEVGYFIRSYVVRVGATSRQMDNYLTIREVLDEPLVVPAGQGATVTLNITFNGFEVLSSASATTE